MTWNYRIVETTGEYGDKYRGIYEVYYDDEGNPSTRTSLPSRIEWEVDNYSDFHQLEKIQLAFNKPVLTEDDFIGEVF